MDEERTGKTLEIIKCNDPERIILQPPGSMKEYDGWNPFVFPRPLLFRKNDGWSISFG